MVTPTTRSLAISKLTEVRFLTQEIELWKSLEEMIAKQRVRREIMEAHNIADEALVDRLVDAGLSAQSLPAISIAPIAAIAWASGNVSIDEAREAIKTILHSELSDNSAAFETFESWLNARPPAGLMQIWADYTKYQLQSVRPSLSQAMGRYLRQQAETVAMASGGFLGFGKVCPAEREILNAIDRVFGTANPGFAADADNQPSNLHAA